MFSEDCTSGGELLLRALRGFRWEGLAPRQGTGPGGGGRGSPGLGSLSKGRPCQAGAAALGPLGVSVPEEEGGTDSAWIVSTPWPVERGPTIFRGPAERSSRIPGGQG